MKRAVILFILLSAGLARANPEVDAAIDALNKAAPGQPRLEAAAALQKLATEDADAVLPLIKRLQRTDRASTDAERREVLARFKADVPDEKGRFKSPGRPPPGGWKTPDWLAELAAMPEATPAVIESFETVAILRALGSTQRPEAAEAILEFAFDPVGLVYRDECGRKLRDMAPWSFPALLKASADKKRDGGSYGRYATYQLDRLDKGRPSYALESAPNDELEARMLRAIGEVKHPDAVTAVLDRCNSPSHTIRRAAREAWNAYVTGPPPPPAPKAKRKLPGGKLTDEELPLYLTYRELAYNELNRRLLEMDGREVPVSKVSGVPPPMVYYDKKADAEKLTQIYFEKIDAQRTAIWDEKIAQAKALAAQGKWDEVSQVYDAILTDDPMYAKRGEMAAGYLEAGNGFGAAGQWDKAVLAYHKAHTIDPDGPRAKEAEGQLFYARAMRAKAAGKDGSEDLARALAADPNNQNAQQAAKASARGRVAWMLWAGIAAGVVAVGLILVAVAMRRRTA